MENPVTLSIGSPGKSKCYHPPCLQLCCRFGYCLYKRVPWSVSFADILAKRWKNHVSSVLPFLSRQFWSQTLSASCLSCVVLVFLLLWLKSLYCIHSSIFPVIATFSYFLLWPCSPSCARSPYIRFYECMSGLIWKLLRKHETQAAISTVRLSKIAVLLKDLHRPIFNGAII